MHKALRIFKKFWPIGVLTLLAIALRTVNLDNFFYFTYDESVFAFVGRRFALWNHIPLIGGVTPFGFHVAPYFYWFFSATLALGNLDPLIWGYISALIAGATTFMIFIVGRELFSKRIAFTAAIIWTFSYLANISDRHFWGLTFGPLFSLLIIFFLKKTIEGKQKYVYFLGIALALIIHADLSFYTFGILTFFTLLICKQSPKKFLIIFSFIAISFLPLLIFDIRHSFANTRPAIKFLESGQNKPGIEKHKVLENILIFPKVFTRLAYPYSDNEIPKNYSYCRIYFEEKFSKTPWYFYTFASILLILFFRLNLRNKNVGVKIISSLFAIYFLGIQLYGSIFKGDIHEHYLSGLLTVFVLIFAWFLSFLPKKLWIIIIILFMTFNLHKLFISTNSHGLKYKKEAVEFTMQKIGNEPFSLESLSTCWRLSGFRYLFAVYGREPVKSYVDPNFGYLYGTTPIADEHPRTVVAIVLHDFSDETEDFYKKYSLFKSHEVENNLFGNIEVIVMDNSSKWFDKAP